MEVDGLVLWGSAWGNVYSLDELNSKWKRVAFDGEYGAPLAVCGRNLVSVGSYNNGVYSKKVKVLRGDRQSFMPDLLVGCAWSSVVSVSGGGLVVMGGTGDGDRLLDVVQVFDGKTQTWHKGPSIPLPCSRMSAGVHGDLVFLMGGEDMERQVWCTDICELVSHQTYCVASLFHCCS